MKKTIMVVPTETELAWLIEQTSPRGIFVDLSFGPAGAWMDEDPGSPSEAYKLLLWKRGVGTENLHGAGI